MLTIYHKVRFMKNIILFILITSISLFAEVEFQQGDNLKAIVVTLRDSLGNEGGQIIIATNGSNQTVVTTLPHKKNNLVLVVDDSPFVFHLSKGKRGDVYTIKSKSIQRDLIYTLIRGEIVECENYSSDLKGFAQYIENLM